MKILKFHEISWKWLIFIEMRENGENSLKWLQIGKMCKMDKIYLKSNGLQKVLRQVAQRVQNAKMSKLSKIEKLVKMRKVRK